MNTKKNLLIVLGEWWEERQANRSEHRRNLWNDWLPSRGNVLFTLVMIAVLLWAQSAGAVPFRAESAASTGTIAYQGRLADSSGNPLTQTLNMRFRLYKASTGGAPLWTEQWTGSNGVQVSDGLFNVMLGSLTPIPQSVITGNSSLFLGITVGTDDEMSPRVQLGSVPFAVQALTVPDGSITKAKLAGDVVLQPVRLHTMKSDQVSTSSASDWTDIPGMTITHSFAEGIMKAQFCALMTLGASNVTGYVRIIVDGVSQTETRFSVNQLFGWHAENVCLHALTSVSDGEHTVAVQWKTNGPSLYTEADRVLIVEQ